MKALTTTRAMVLSFILLLTLGSIGTLIASANDPPVTTPAEGEEVIPEGTVSLPTPVWPTPSGTPSIGNDDDQTEAITELPATGAGTTAYNARASPAPHAYYAETFGNWF